MSERKPTAGALRAAKEILDTDHQLAASIIDREMGSPKVEELLKMILSQEGNGPLRYMPPKNCAALDKKAREVEAALGGKAE